MKVLISLLIAVLMVSFLIFPAVEKQQELRFEQEEVQQKQEEMQHSMDNIKSARAAVEKTKQDLQTISTPYYTFMEKREIDELVTGLAYRYELFPARLTMGQYLKGTLPPYLYSKEGMKQAEEYAGIPQEEAAPESYVQAVEASITLLGSQQKFLSLLDDIEKNYPSVQVKDFDVSRKTYMNTSMELVEETQASLTLRVYMCKNSDTIQEKER